MNFTRSICYFCKEKYVRLFFISLVYPLLPPFLLSHLNSAHLGLLEVPPGGPAVTWATASPAGSSPHAASHPLHLLESCWSLPSGMLLSIALTSSNECFLIPHHHFTGLTRRGRRETHASLEISLGRKSLNQPEHPVSLHPSLSVIRRGGSRGAAGWGGAGPALDGDPHPERVRPRENVSGPQGKSVRQPEREESV